MKKMRGAMRLVALVLVVTFISMAGFMTYTVYTQGSRWLVAGSNPRLQNARKNVSMGIITDRTGLVLANNDEQGVRQYAKNKQVRRALSQTVGDQMSMSGTGVETFHAGTLLGLSGSVIDRTWQYLTGKNYKGANLQLTASAELTTYLSEQFPSGYEGSICVLNYKTGEILAMVSKPDYDPEQLATRQASNDVQDTAYLNRCLQGQYAPGSVFKVITLLSALENLPGIDQRTFTCEGSRAIGEGKVTCFGGEVHGNMTLPQAFAKSCNITFAALALELGADRLSATAKRLGFNENFSFRDIVLYQSSIPESIEDVSELAWTGDGQGRLLVTPMHMAMIAGAIAGGGIMREPQLIAQVSGVGGIPHLRAPLGPGTRIMTTDMATLISRYMQRTVESGTATSARIKGYTVCGKTGTAETSNDKSTRDNAWFIGFIADESAPYAVSVVVEQSGTGGSVAAPLAAKALKKAITLGL